MIKHNFKIGDKVKLKNPKQFKFGTKILTIVKEAEVDNNRYIHVVYKGLAWGYFPLLPHEIEYVSKVGEQLVFSFMRGQSRKGD